MGRMWKCGMKPSSIILSALDADLITEIEACETNYDLFRILRILCAEYGCQHFMVSELPRDDDFSLQEQLIVSNWDPELIREFDLKQKTLFTSLFHALRAAVVPLYLDLPVQICEPQSTSASIAGATGPCVFFPVFDHAGHKGMIGFSMSDIADEGRLVNLNFLCNFLFNHFMHIKKKTSVQHNTLSEREIQCLNWTALGKTSYEIGIILDISLNTVNHYINNASRKLNCVNKTHAVAKCVQNGII